MNSSQPFLDTLGGLLLSLVPAAGVVVIFVALIYLINSLMARRTFFSEGHRYRRQLVNTGTGLLGIIVLILVLPVGNEVQGQLLSLIGIIVSAAIALSSTTVLGNALAGFMLRVVKGFRMGDFISVNEHFGRVSERGLFHTEIQTEQRELTTLPNLYLVQNPVTTVRSSGTAITASVSLGYDVPRGKVEKLLKEAALAAGLEEPFVHVMDLGNFAVSYRVSGLLSEVKGLITARSRLRAAILDILHENGVEIVSPTFMYRRSADEKTFIPDLVGVIGEEEEEKNRAEDLIFDKAEEAASREESIQILTDRLEEIENELDSDPTEERAEQLKTQKERIEKRLETLAAQVTERGGKKVEGEGPE